MERRPDADIDTGVLLTIAAAYGFGDGTTQDRSGRALGASGLTSLAGSNPWMNLAMIYVSDAGPDRSRRPHNAAAVLSFPVSDGEPLSALA